MRIVTRQGEIASPFASELIFQFTPSYLYEWDEPRRGDLRPGGPAVDEDLLDALLEAPEGARLLDPQALGRVESRLRRRGLAPRTAEEMAETLRALGDLAGSELFGPAERLLEELRQEGRAVADRPYPEPPSRALDPGRGRSRAIAAPSPSSGEHDLEALGSIVRQYLRHSCA